jgi:Uma2 family endonuclease
MKWQEVIEHPSLQDLPFKIELNEYGTILMSPASNRRGRLQGKLYSLLGRQKMVGELYLECSINTRKGIRVADVAWGSAAFFKKYGEQTPLPVAPDICVEILSPSNFKPEIEEKIDLYLAKGAKEVWLCDNEVNLTIHTPQGTLDRSAICKNFPTNILQG